VLVLLPLVIAPKTSGRLKAAGFTGGQAAKALGLGAKGDRTVRRWIGGDSAIPYAAWALLCDFGNLGQIWKKD
jgi:hypothetical protein